jgi:hypothetical protein
MYGRKPADATQSAMAEGRCWSKIGCLVAFGDSPVHARMLLIFFTDSTTDYKVKGPKQNETIT